MSEHPNAQLMRDVYAAFTVGDVQRAASYWTPDCIHHYPGRSPLAGSHEGIESALAFAGRMFELTHGGIEMEILDIGASDAYSYALVRTVYRLGERVLEMPFVNVSRIVDGKIAEFWTYPDDQNSIDEFWEYAIAANAAYAN